MEQNETKKIINKKEQNNLNKPKNKIKVQR